MNLVRVWHSSQLLRHNVIFLVGSLLVGALNYLYYPILGRLVSPGVFGEVQTLVSLFLQLGVFLAVASMVIVTVVANYTDPGKRNRLIFEFEKLALLVGAVLLGLSLLFGKQLQDWLHFDSNWPFAVLALTMIVSVPFYIRGAFLRGQQRFGIVSAGNIVGAGGKLALSALLVGLGLGTAGAIGGLLLAQVVACILIVWWASQLGLAPGTGRRFRWPNLALLAPELRYGGIVLAVSLAITMQYSIDIVVIKHYFDATTAGLYAGVAAVARILFFLTASIPQVLISKVRIRDGAQNQHLLGKSLLLLLALSLPVLVAIVVAPSQILKAMMGETYTHLASVLPLLSISIFIVSITNLLAAYYLALRRFGIAVLAVVGAGFTYLFIFLHHGSPMAIVESLLLGSAATIVSIGVWILTERRCRAT